jgi:hypothetical protein
MFTITIVAYFVNGDQYSITTDTGESTIWTRNTNNQIVDLPSWNEILATAIDTLGDNIINKSIVVDPTSNNMVVLV